MLCSFKLYMSPLGWELQRKLMGKKKGQEKREESWSLPIPDP